MPITLNTRDTGFETAFAAFLAGKRENAADVDAAVAEIVEQVATRGDAALIEYTKRFDRIDLAPATLRLTQAEIAAGADAAPADTVPAPNGVLNPLVLAAARLVGIDEIYRVGGAQAVAALAHGTATIKPVDKIVGPGNAYVAAAKRRVFGRVGIDMIAGPSEILVVAGADNDPAWIAADLLSQAEHDDAAQAILISDDGDFAAAVEREIGRHLQRLPRADTARASWAAN